MKSELKFYIRREAVGELVRDARFVPRASYIKIGEKFDEEIGMWIEGEHDGIPILLIEDADW